MSPFDWFKWACDVDAGSPAAKAVLFGIVRHVDADGACWAGQDRIAANASTTERTVRDNLPRLIARRILAIEVRGGRSSVYRMTPEGYSAWAEAASHASEGGSATPEGASDRKEIPPERKEVPVTPEGDSGGPEGASDEEYKEEYKEESKEESNAPEARTASPPALFVVEPQADLPKPKRAPKSKATSSSQLWADFRDRWKALHGSELGDNPPKSVGIEARAKDHGPDAVRLLIRWWAESQDSRARFLRENRVEAKTLFGPEKFSEYMAAWVRPWAASTGAAPPTANPAPTATSPGAEAWADMLTRPHVAAPFPEFIGWIVRTPAQWNDPQKVKLAADPVEHGRRLKAFIGPGALGMRWEADHRLREPREQIRLDFIARYEATP